MLTKVTYGWRLAVPRIVPLMDPALVIAAVAAVVLAVVVVAALVRWRKRHPDRRMAPAAVGSRDRPMRVRERLPVVLMVAGFACAVIAFAQTRIERQSTQGTVILTMESVSKFDATDRRGQPASAAQDAAEAFLSRLPGDFQVGVVTFADGATLAVEPTKDREEAGAALESTASSQGTAIGDGMTASLDAIESTWAQGGPGPAAIVLLSDGRDTGSVVSPDQAAARAQEQGIPVFTVTLGATEGGSTASADDDLMRRIADGTGGSTFNALSADQLTDVYQELGSTLSSDLHVGSSAWIFVLLGGVFALAAVVVLFMPATPAEYRAAPKPGSSKRPARSRS